MTKHLNIQQWILICLLIRLAVMPFTVHGDMYFVYKYPHFFSHGEWNVYALQGGVPYYPPVAVLFFALVQFIYSLLFPGFEDFTHLMANTNMETYEADHIFLTHFLMKLPYLVFEFFLIKDCLRMLPDKKDRINFIVFWTFNPMVIYAAFMVGHMDLIPTYFVVLACYFSLKEGKGHYACLALAVGALFKVFPIIFLPMILCISSRNIKDAFRLSLYCLLPIILIYGIFYLLSGSSVFNIFQALSYRDFSASKDTGNIFLRLLQLFVYFFVCFHILLLRPSRLNYFTLIQCFLAVYFAAYWGHLISSTHRYVWFIPFMILFVQKHPKWEKPFYLLLVTIFLAGFRSRGSCLGIFGPLNPEFFFSIPSLKDITWYLFGPMYDIVIESLFKVITAAMTLLLLKNIYSTTHEKSE